MIRHRWMLFCAGACAFLFAASMLAAEEHEGHHWGYSGKYGPDHWAELDKSFAACNAGQRQSPIAIVTAKRSDLPVLQFEYKSTPLHIVNNGHTIQINYAPGSFISVGDKRYELKQLHFHHPSEEKINGKGFAMVAHLVHADSEGNLAVVAVLLDADRPNQLIEDVWRHLPAHPGPEKVYDDVRISAAGLLPADHGYFRFSGSLTTPPCSENVAWFVLKTPQSISTDQADTFGRIYPLNARPVQPLNGREILETK